VSKWSGYSPGRLLALTAVVLVVVSGCSDRGVKKVTINGTVSYRGQPVPSGMLRFVGAEGSYSAGVIQSDGTFIITDVVPGEVKIGVMQRPQSTGDSSGKGGNKPRKPPVMLPAKYLNPDTSGVKYTIASDSTTLNVEFP
jgi:hypothetical protein